MSDVRAMREFMKSVSVVRCTCGGWMEPRKKGDRELQCNDCRLRKYAPIKIDGD